jgi:hypothetical protein
LLVGIRSDCRLVKLFHLAPETVEKAMNELEARVEELK